MRTFDATLMRAILASALTLVSGSGFADTYRIEEHMSHAEFTAAGLDRLTPEELKKLNAWLADRDKAAEPDSEPAPDEAFGLSDSKLRAKDAESKGKQRIRSRIDGEFSGWTGKTRFKLENGQVWQQRSGGSYYFKAQSPDVEVFKNRLGFYVLKVLETKRSIGVKRIE